MNQKRFSSKRGIAIYLCVALILVGTGFTLIYKNFFTKTAYLDRARTDYANELTNFDTLLNSYGLLANNVAGQNCNNLEGDKHVHLNCEVTQKSADIIDTQLIDRWAEQSKQLEHYLDDNGWHKEPNLDPVTDNPINSLTRLLEYKGAYDADVSYTKEKCSITFNVVAAGANNVPELHIARGCDKTLGSFL